MKKSKSSKKWAKRYLLVSGPLRLQMFRVKIQAMNHHILWEVELTALTAPSTTGSGVNVENNPTACILVS